MESFKLYIAYQMIWGSTFPKTVYFETIKERNDFVRNTDYTEKGGSVTLNPEQYAQWKKFGEWRNC